jgi:hypothetical protein
LLRLLGDPGQKAVQLLAERVERCNFRVGVVPIDVESGLDAAGRQQGNIRLLAHLFDIRAEGDGDALGDLPASMAEQVDGVLNPPGPL